MRAYLSRTSAPTPVLIRAANGFQIILGKVRPITSPGREPSTSSDHCSINVHYHPNQQHSIALCGRGGLHNGISRGRFGNSLSRAQIGTVYVAEDAAGKAAG